MFGNLLLHDTIAELMNSIVANPPQGLLLVGPEGIGKLSVAQALAMRIVNHPTSVRTIPPDDKGTIAIETIRELYKSTRSRQDGQQVVIIERADRMSMEAENAFLKLLEEPRAGLTFMLTALQLESLLPTILSRVQHIALQPLPDDVIRRFVVSKKPGIAQNDLSQLVFLAQGRPGIATMLLSEGALPKHRERMQLVKQLISASPYERFVNAAKLASSRDETVETLNAMARVVEVQLSSVTNVAQAKHWSLLAEALEDTLQAITHNGNVRAQLLYLFSRY